LGSLLEFAHRRLCQLKECLVVGLEGLRRERRESFSENCLGFSERGQPLLRRLSFRGEGRCECHARAVCGGQSFPKNIEFTSMGRGFYALLRCGSFGVRFDFSDLSVPFV
ncbi:MAG TPA: hypothetical protein VHW65_07935, partial [Gemmatimonadales bacterium]|nr:hypothetical protein [Gemmatimonadales bacterium]